MDEEEDKDAEEVEAGVNPPILPPSFAATYYILLKVPETTSMKGRSTLPIQQMMMMIAKDHLLLLPCCQTKPAEEVRSGRQEKG